MELQTLPVRSARIGGVMNADGTSLEGGLLIGFITQQDASAIPMTVPQIGTLSLAPLLAGGPGCPSAPDARDVHEGEIGWWLHIGITAEAAELLAP